MAIYRYIVTVETDDNNGLIDAQLIAGEIDANLESVIRDYGLNHFTVEPLSTVYGEPLRVSQFDAFETAPLSPDGRYQS